MATVKEILGETERFIQAKQASFQGKQALAGEDPNAMPGAEHDKPIPEGAKAPDKEVDDGTQGPKGSHSSTDGAGDDSPVTRGHAVDAETPVDSASEKPLVTADANAKTAEMCNDLLTDIRNYRAGVAKAAAEAKPEAQTEKPAEAKPEAKPEAQTEKPAEAKPGKPAEAAPEAQTEKPAEASGLNLELTAEFLQKIGAIILSTEEGTAFVDEQLRKHAGAETAKELLGFITEQSEEAEKIAAAEQGAADAQAMIADAIYRQGYAAALKQAGVKDVEGLMAKLGQEVADASIDQLMGAAPEGAAGMDVAPEQMGAEEAAPEAGGDEEISAEDVVAALEMLVSEGQLDPQDAEAILANLGLGGEAPAEAAPAEAAPAESAPAEAAPVEEEPAQ